MILKTSDLFLFLVLNQVVESQVGVDPFYNAPKGFERSTPGTVFRYRKVKTNLNGFRIGTESWQILYRTTESHGKPIVTAATIIKPFEQDASFDHPLIAYQFPEDGLDPKCAPSFKLTEGLYYMSALIFPLLLRRWIVVAPDFEGPKSEYLVGALEGQAVLDSIRATLNFRQAGRIDRNKIGLAGYSGGAHATIWAAELQPTYAPELKLTAVVAGGVPVDIRAIADYIDGGVFAGVELAGSVGISRGYPEFKLKDTLNTNGIEMLQKIGKMCIEEYAMYYAFRRLNYFTKLKYPLLQPLALNNLKKVDLGQRVPSAPIFIYEAVFDQLIPFEDVQNLVKFYCDSGVRVEFDQSWMAEHNSMAAIGAFKAYQFIADRFEGKDFITSCKY